MKDRKINNIKTALTTVASLASTNKNTINSILQKSGIITDQEVNALEEDIRLAKLKLLEAESRQSAYRYTLYVFAGLTALGLLWYFTKEKTK
jgi:glutamine synthetase type III